MPDAYRANRILIIDDSLSILEQTGAILQRCGFEQIHFAEDGMEGFEMTVELVPDLVIVDLMMPRMDGYEYCGMVRKLEQFHHMPIIVQTSLAAPEKRGEAFLHGATDVLLKPVGPGEMVARVRVHVERLNFQKQLQQYRTRVERELEQARRMQEDILPGAGELSRALADRPLALRSHFEASEALSGDFWGVFPLSPERLAFYLVDFTGHGLLAALNTFRLHTLIHSGHPPGDEPGEYLTRLNEALSPLLPVQHFATMLYAVVDTAADTLSFASAASPAPLLVRANGEAAFLPEEGGPPLSVDRNARYRSHVIPFGAGDTLLCFSDALIEAELPGGELYGTERLERCCRALLSARGNARIAAAPEILLDGVRSSVHEATGSRRFEDDLTLLALGRPLALA
jgi:sigma-B regulation protein RsbU (phosphoserine phosphatase)